jgi:hypothetical protein
VGEVLRSIGAMRYHFERCSAPERWMVLRVCILGARIDLTCAEAMRYYHEEYPIDIVEKTSFKVCIFHRRV